MKSYRAISVARDAQRVNLFLRHLNIAPPTTTYSNSIFRRNFLNTSYIGLKIILRYS